MDKRKNMIDWTEKKIQKSVDQLGEILLDAGKDTYHSNLESFESYKEKQKNNILNDCAHLSKQYQKAYDLIMDELIIGKEKLTLKEKETLLKEIKKGQENLKATIESEKMAKKLETGTQTFQDILGYSNHTLELFYELGLNFFNKQDYQNAGALFSFLTLLNPNCHLFWVKQGMCLQVEDKWELALNAFFLAQATDPTDPLPYLFASECYAEINENALAIESVDKAIELADNDTEADYKEFKIAVLKWKKEKFK